MTELDVRLKFGKVITTLTMILMRQGIDFSRTWDLNLAIDKKTDSVLTSQVIDFSRAWDIRLRRVESEKINSFSWLGSQSHTWAPFHKTYHQWQNDSFCYKLVKSLLLIGYKQICHWFLSSVIEKRLCETGSQFYSFFSSSRLYQHTCCLRARLCWVKYILIEMLGGGSVHRMTDLIQSDAPASQRQRANSANDSLLHRESKYVINLNSITMFSIVNMFPICSVI